MAEEAQPTAEKRLSVDDRVGLDSFEFDEEPFITVDTKLCLDCELKPCLYVCPSKVYRWEDNGLVYNTEGCIELGACFIVCHELGNKAIRWSYPRGGKGVQFKFG
jgi:ferredoxin like protein